MRLPWVLGLIGKDGKESYKSGKALEPADAQRLMVPTSSPQPTFYLNDHLGNTRVTFHADVCVNNTTVTYFIDHAIDYYPYGKTLREYFTPARERYLSTQHERDTETGYVTAGPASMMLM
jgi:hypothetical protein